MNVAQFLPLLGGAGGVGTAVGVLLTRRQAQEEKRERAWLVEDEILGHERARGIPAKPGLSDRLGLVELAAAELQKTTERVHALGEAAAADSAAIALNLAADQAASERLADAFDKHVMDDSTHFQEILDILHHHSLTSTPDTEETDTP